MKKHIISIFALLLCASMSWAEVDSSTSLKTYYATANGKADNTLRLALFDIIKGHTQIGYSNLGTIMQWSDTEGADGQHIVDIYTNCTFTCSGPVTWISSGAVGAGLNREHTVPQSWFNSNEPMKSDAFHVYPTDTKANNNRSSYLYGECANGTSASSQKCAETGKLGASDWTTGTITYTGTVYEPADEYKGDLARTYFYMATRYADVCANWSGGAFGSADNGLGAYTAALMLKWHRQDPVSEKELIRNEVIYGNVKYNKSNKKQGNRNPFIDYPELVEYIWGNKKGQSVTISVLDSPYANESPEEQSTGIEDIEIAGPARKMLINGQLYIIVEEQMFDIMGRKVK